MNLIAPEKQVRKPVHQLAVAVLSALALLWAGCTTTGPAPLETAPAGTGNPPARAESPGWRLPVGFSAVGTATDPASGLPLRIRCDKINYELVFIPPGEFTMGSPDGVGKSDEHPQHRLRLDAYYIGLTEVSNAQLRACTARHNSGDFEGRSLNADNQPAVEVTWNMAYAFCGWAGMTLPTEAQWEKAARGTDGRSYPWGNQWPPPRGAGNYTDATTERALRGWSGISGYDDGYAVTCPVGTFGTGNPYGLQDMGGNVAEYCLDWYTPQHDPAHPPTDPLAGSERVARGGSWYVSEPGDIRVTGRIRVERTTHDSGTGFRGALVVGR